MEKKNGVFYIPCKINGLELQFILDTGASDVTISKSESLFMLKNGYLDEADLLDKQYYELADGKITEGTKINLKKIEIGDIILENVAASVVNTQVSPLLLGQTVLERFDEIKIDNYKRLLYLIKYDSKPDESSNIIQSKEELLSKIMVSSEQLVENPRNTDAILNIAVNKMKLGENESAIKDLKNLIDIDKNHAEAYFYRGKLFALTNKKQNAILDLSKVIELSPYHAEAFFERGLLKADSKDFKSAILDFDKAIKLSPIKDKRMLKHRADAKYELKDYQAAIKDYDAIISLESNHSNLAEIHFYLGLSKKYLKDYQGAYAEFSRANELNDLKVDYLIYSADMLVLLQDYKNALKIISLLIDKNPNNIELYFRRAHIKTVLKDYRGAIYDYDLIQNLNSSEHRIFELRAEVQYVLNNFENALNDYNEALKYNDKSTDLLISKANTLTQLKYYIEAIEVYNQVIIFKPNDADAYTNRGLAFFQLNQLHAACLDWSRAGELGFQGVYEYIKKHCN